LEQLRTLNVIQGFVRDSEPDSDRIRWIIQIDRFNQEMFTTDQAEAFTGGALFALRVSAN